MNDISSQNPRLKMDSRLAKRLVEKKDQLDQYRPLPPGMVRRLQEDLRVTLTYHSNAIEGNSLDLFETRMVIEDGLTVGGHPLKDYLEATNHAQAFNLMVDVATKKELLTLEVVKEIHRLVMQNIHEEAGQFRTRQNYITGATKTPPPAREVPEYMRGWAASLTRGDYRQLDPVTRAAIAHHDFEFIHPFADGNGRTGRLLLNLMLMQEGYPPTLIRQDWRTGYIRSLQEASASANYRPIINLVGRAVEIGLDLYLEACPKAPEEIYQSLTQLLPESGFSVNYLGWLVRQGRISGIKRGRRWYSTSSAIQRYKAEVAQKMYSPGRPKKRL